MRRTIQFLSGFSIFGAFFFSGLWSFSFANRVLIHRDRDKYTPETFIVTGGKYDSGGEHGPSWWLIGTVNGHEERLVPNIPREQEPHSSRELLQRRPKGSRIDVLYNPAAIRSIVQNESLRVIEVYPDFWEKEREMRQQLGLFVLVPLPLTITAYLVIRYLNRNRRWNQKGDSTLPEP